MHIERSKQVSVDTTALKGIRCPIHHGGSGPRLIAVSRLRRRNPRTLEAEENSTRHWNSGRSSRLDALSVPRRRRMDTKWKHRPLGRTERLRKVLI